MIDFWAETMKKKWKNIYKNLEKKKKKSES